MQYVLHDMRAKRSESFAESDFRKAFRAFIAWQRGKRECALWHGSDGDGWKRLYATSNYPTVSRPWK